ncbi:NAD(P)-dependent oxidoreductase [Diaphorobacter sp. HDW4A]|uniref:NAD(P)-dependent oxidoreductase n=1 Tax=Diaphorobacter sp. HDW4A TaxID=2714924 RepID=UPI00140B8818|nr:NAD(P)-dependent oxidoreductase [Diaphorobacter sp. HDW4A]QIL79355.1 NAD(P)-dependent oxidoreductase [Diaphorobacter sp. HDW4A]
MNTPIQKIGFIGLGVMGEPMCANLLRKSGLPVTIFDQTTAPIERLKEQGAKTADSIEAVAVQADVVFLSLPSIKQVEVVATALLNAAVKPRMIVDMSTSDVAKTRALAEKVKAAGIEYVDAPVARTKEAAVNGTLFITVGATPEQFQQLQPLLSHLGSDVLHCGGTGCGQIVKILNNITVLMSVNALAEVLTIGRKAGMDSKELFEALSKGSADSFVLRNHGMKYMVPDNFPEKVFPVDYALKDASLALALAEEAGFKPHIAQYTCDLLKRTQEAGFSQNYHPVMIKLVDGRA